MQNQDFENKIKKSMEDLASQLHPGKGSWEKMEERLGAEIKESAPEERLADKEFDKSVKEKLSTKDHYSFNNWKKLSDKLDLQEERVRSVYRHKLLEAAIILFLFYTTLNVFDLPQLNIRNTAEWSAASAPSLQQHNERNVNASTKTKAKSIKDIGNTNRFSKSKVNPFATVSELNTPKLKELKFALQESSTPPTYFEQKNIRVPLSFLQAKTGNISSHSKAREVSILKASKVVKKQRYSLGFAAVLNLNEIHTPSDNFFGKEINSYNRYNLGGGGGFTLRRENKLLSYETGLIYLSKRYSPKQLTVVGQNMKGVKFEETLNNVQVNMLEIPFNCLYLWNPNNKKTSFYGGLGTTINLVTQANYDNDRNYLIPVYALSSLDNSQPPSEIKKIKKFNYGLLEGGNFRENTYLSAQLVLGLEYRINEKISFFNQATFQRQFTATGIGANKNYFHAYSIWMGLKTHF